MEKLHSALAAQEVVGCQPPAASDLMPQRHALCGLFPVQVHDGKQQGCWSCPWAARSRHSLRGASLTTELRAEVPSTHFHFLPSLTCLMCTSLLHLLLLLITYPSKTFSHNNALAHLIPSQCLLLREPKLTEQVNCP